MREFCTLFDSNYLVKALAMYESLERWCPEFRLTAFCFDDEAADVLDELALAHVAVVRLAELEAADPELRSTKEDRTPVEYCWTATPALPRFLLATRPELDEITYLDADLLFFGDPEPLFEEMGDASVLITPHRFAPMHRHQEVHGIYNVQFLTFRRDARGQEVLDWWHARCIEWCYYRLEDGKLGDQKYLDDWPERFEGIHVLEHRGGGLAPWNISQYELRARGGRIWVDDDPLVFFHYHRVRLLTNGRHKWRPAGYPITRREKRLVYRPYLAAIGRAHALARSVRPGFSAGFEEPAPLPERLRELRFQVLTDLKTRAPWLARAKARLRPS